MAEHYLDDSQVHSYWDNALPPRLEIEPGDIVVFECREASDNQVTPELTSEELTTLDPSPIHPLTGPVYVKSAHPGDALEVDVISFRHKGWGWNSIYPGVGLLAEDFPEPYLHHWRLEGDTCYFDETGAIALPFEPICGVMGVARQDPGRHSTIPPRENGGNLDIRSLGPGATVWLPIWVEGALFSIGDCHAAQGDGEICGTGIESPMTVTLRINLRRGANLPGVQFRTPSPLSLADNRGYFATTAYGPDLYENAQNAVRQMIAHLVTTHDLTRNEAYVLCGAAVDLKISEIVDAPNWIVAAYVPLSVFKA